MSAARRLELAPEAQPPWLAPRDVVRCATDGLHPPRGRVVGWLDGAPAFAEGPSGVEACFDLAAAIDDLLAERHSRHGRPITRWLPFHYHKVPSRARLLIKRALTAVAERTPWTDKSVETLRWLRDGRRANGVVGPGWPEGRRYAVCLSHDIDTAEGLRAVERIAREEERRGWRSAWNFVGLGYEKPDALLRRLADAGHEIGLHGDTHDNTLAYEPPARIRARLDRCADFVARWNIRGFRSPSLCRTPALMEALAERFDWDSSVPDSEEGGGCASVFPFRCGRLVELPLTVPMDASLLFQGLDARRIVRLWKAKVDWIRQVGGLAMVTTHPEPVLGGHARLVDAYARFLDDLGAHADAWRALPCAVAQGWRSHSWK